MDDELENLLDKNNTDELYDFDFDITGWDYFQDVLSILFTTVGVAADIIIIMMIARNARMRSKTNLLLMNFAINDALFLVSNIHFLSSFFQLVGMGHVMYFYNCLLSFLDVGFQFNAGIFVLILISNTLVKNKRLKVKWLLIGVYTFVVVDFMAHIIMCQYNLWPVLYLICFGLFMVILCVVVFKEFNNCYKKWYKKDPLSGLTLFRLNIGRIYIGSWFSTFICYFLADAGFRYFFYTIAIHSFMASLYILIFIVCADKNFMICLLSLLKCKGAGDYDVDATITFADDSSEGSVQNNQVNINFTGRDNPMQTHIQDISTIRVP